MRKANQNITPVLDSLAIHRGTENTRYFYHGDHLGSSSWITDKDGNALQYISYLPYGQLFWNLKTTSYDASYKFIGKERDSETGFDYFGARYYSNTWAIWLSVDPLADKYPSLSPYNYCAGNPIVLKDPDGRKIDLSNLTPSEREAYNAKIEKLCSNKLFYAYYNRLTNSEKTYYIMTGSGAGGSGSFSPSTNQIHSVDDIEVLAQEMFHAYQSDLGVYNSNDLSVRETEGDLVSSVIALSLDILSMGTPWGNDIVFNYVDNDFNFNESVLTSAFDSDFNKAVDARINYYINREITYGAKANETYTQKNSSTGALALKKLFREVGANQNMVGPKLQNGDFYSK